VQNLVIEHIKDQHRNANFDNLGKLKLNKTDNIQISELFSPSQKRILKEELDKTLREEKVLKDTIRMANKEIAQTNNLEKSLPKIQNYLRNQKISEINNHKKKSQLFHQPTQTKMK
jgi:homoaconitase/3-isopropylmalate dehydratase large subunit